MACNRDEHCKEIASDYETKIGEVNSAFEDLKSDIDGIKGNLQGLIVPNDYLGSKVKDKISSLEDVFGTTSENITGIKGAVIQFAELKRDMHQKHYEDWLKEQEK